VGIFFHNVLVYIFIQQLHFQQISLVGTFKLQHSIHQVQYRYLLFFSTFRVPKHFQNYLADTEKVVFICFPINRRIKYFEELEKLIEMENVLNYYFDEVRVQFIVLLANQFITKLVHKIYLIDHEVCRQLIMR